MWRGPRALCVVVTTARHLCLVLIRWFHPVGWCVVLQRHFGGGSRIAVAFFGAVRSVFLDSLSVRGGTRQWLLEVEKVVSRGPRGVISSVLTSQSDRTCVSWRRVVWLVSMSQSDQLEFFEWSCVRRVLMTQSNLPAL